MGRICAGTAIDQTSSTPQLIIIFSNLINVIRNCLVDYFLASLKYNFSWNLQILGFTKRGLTGFYLKLSSVTLRIAFSFTIGDPLTKCHLFWCDDWFNCSRGQTAVFSLLSKIRLMFLLLVYHLLLWHQVNSSLSGDIFQNLLFWFLDVSLI